MTYKLLYIEDQNPDSIIAELEKNDQFEVTHWHPDSIEKIEAYIDDTDVIVLDFRLTDAETRLDGTSYAQALRTKNSDTHRDIPIVLFSEEGRITDYYKDYTSQDLFDFSIPKGEYRDHSTKFNNRILSVINTYKQIREHNGNLKALLNLDHDQSIDYRIDFTLKKDTYKEDVYAYSSFIYQNLIRSIGVLIGEDILSARLGISTTSDDWRNLKEILSTYKYTGVFSEAYSRWWAEGILAWFKTNTETSLRRLTAEERCEKIKEITGLQGLNSLVKIDKRGYKAKSSKFWTICKETKLPIDYSDGFELYLRDLKPWQEPEYICFLGIHNSSLMANVKPSEKLKIQKIEESLRG